MRAVACTEAPAAAKEHGTGQEERAGHPQSVLASRRHHRHAHTRIPCPPQLTQPICSRVSSEASGRGREQGRRGETLKLSRVAVEAREPVSFTSLWLSFPDSQAVRLRETHPKNVARGVQRSEAIGENCLAALLQANAITVIYPLGSASWSLLR